MKLHDFGLWFKTYDTWVWSTTIPQEPDYLIYYDGKPLSRQYPSFDLVVNRLHPHTLKLNENFKVIHGWCFIGRCLTMDDFEIIANPDYKGTV